MDDGSKWRSHAALSQVLLWYTLTQFLPVLFYVHAHCKVMLVCIHTELYWQLLNSTRDITHLCDRVQETLNTPQPLFPINICLCVEEQTAVQLMIWIIAACHPTTHAPCCEPNSLWMLRSVTRAPARNLHSFHDLYLPSWFNSRGAVLLRQIPAPSLFFLSSVTSLQQSRSHSSFTHFFINTMLCRSPPHSIGMHLHPLPSCMSCCRWGALDVSFKANVNNFLVVLWPKYSLFLFFAKSTNNTFNDTLCMHVFVLSIISWMAWTWLFYL